MLHSATTHRIQSEAVNCGLAEAVARAVGPTDVAQLGAIKGKVKKGKDSKGGDRKGKGKRSKGKEGKGRTER